MQFSRLVFHSAGKYKFVKCKSYSLPSRCAKRVLTYFASHDSWLDSVDTRVSSLMAQINIVSSPLSISLSLSTRSSGPCSRHLGVPGEEPTRASFKMKVLSCVFYVRDMAIAPS